ncbi:MULTISPECIES: PspC domain-containing protein [unclassified Janthinobacterium]|uniref:PspC domain-containing protein n=1 Tax=unclassified Janthinobacterium TaxID=2610881 RepID=UPI00160BB0D9|nr:MULTISPECIES: PspC domain-containing protein [unclassified Janthinobacterium]MBB5367171.1 phage shock protein PspC (stress-responsive transcriptional regulator) [Janthinobacterium sp. K2C7]MBB5380351.1 phage shock protein PspC (stress-responsive transcriptional regulator) [Janthinobacterium sp. K2Li3]MBB5385553.1 phage shock protein PspC (stress-responsive transcriptional regulator) [Janthinobacterium sp. K2E3]
MNVSEEIKRLHDLHLAGALSDAEFAQAKAKLLGGINLDKPGTSSGAESASSPTNDLVQEFNRLRRSRNDRWLGGVCGGLGRASGMEAWIWRLVFVLFTLTFGFGVVIYLLLWIFVPDEEIGITKNEY